MALRKGSRGSAGGQNSLRGWHQRKSATRYGSVLQTAAGCQYRSGQVKEITDKTGLSFPFREGNRCYRQFFVDSIFVELRQ